MNRIYHRDPIRQLPSCRYELFPSLLDSAFNAITGGADDEVQEVSDANAGSTQNLSLNPSISSTEDPNSEQTQKNKIVCPVCLDDDQTVSSLSLNLAVTSGVDSRIPGDSKKVNITNAYGMTCQQYMYMPGVFASVNA